MNSREENLMNQKSISVRESMPRLPVLLIVCCLFLPVVAFAQPSEIQALQQKADQGDPEAMYELGQAYRKGKWVPKDFAKAYDFYSRSALKGSAGGLVGLGVMYQSGQGVKQDYPKALDIYSKAAKQGDARGQHALGYSYHSGKGVTKDYRTAMEWYRKAAAQGYALSMNNIGVLYQQGQGVEENNYTAMEWFHKAADHGGAKAQSYLGYIYKYGKKGASMDGIKAAEYYQKAAEQGHLKSITELVSLYSSDWNNLKKDMKKAVYWLKKAAEQGDVDSQNSLGYKYDRGEDVPKSKKRSLMWYRKAAEQGDAHGQRSLGVNLKDAEEAREWLFKSAAQNYGLALGRLSTTYYGGPEGSSKSHVLSYMWASIHATSDDSFEKEQGVYWRDMLVDRMTPEDIELAQDMTLEWIETDEQERVVLAKKYHARLWKHSYKSRVSKKETVPVSGGTTSE